jgi:hypothetical protein
MPLLFSVNLSDSSGVNTRLAVNVMPTVLPARTIAPRVSPPPTGISTMAQASGPSFCGLKYKLSKRASWCFKSSRTAAALLAPPSSISRFAASCWSLETKKPANPGNGSPERPALNSFFSYPPLRNGLCPYGLASHYSGSLLNDGGRLVTSA